MEQLEVKIGLFLLFGGALFGFFKTKGQGWGRYTTSVLLLILVLLIVAMGFLLGRTDSQPFLNILFAIAGYAGGVLSGEHGIGLEKQRYMKKAMDPVALKLMKDIKHLFDPNGILNPGKFV